MRYCCCKFCCALAYSQPSAHSIVLSRACAKNILLLEVLEALRGLFGQLCSKCIGRLGVLISEFFFPNCRCSLFFPIRVWLLRPFVRCQFVAYGEIGQPSSWIGLGILHCPLGDFCLYSPSGRLGEGRTERWAHNLRNGFGVPLPELGVESSCCHLPITLDPMGTGHQSGVRGWIWANWFPWPCNFLRVEVCKRKLYLMSGLLREVAPDIFCERSFEVRPLRLKLWKMIANNNRNCLPTFVVRALCLQLVYFKRILTSPCSFCQTLALHTLPTVN